MMGLDNSILGATGILFNMSNEVESSRLLAAKHPEVSTLPSVVLLDNLSPGEKCKFKLKVHTALWKARKVNTAVSRVLH
jgi:hypothetical protein